MCFWPQFLQLKRSQQLLGTIMEAFWPMTLRLSSRIKLWWMVELFSLLPHWKSAALMLWTVVHTAALLKTE